MAEKPLKSLKFHGLDDIYKIPSTAEDVGALPFTGGDMAGSINMNGQKLNGLNAPTEDDEAATKGYTDQQITDRVILSGGKNLLRVTGPNVTRNGVVYTNNGDGTITISGVSTGETVGYVIGEVELKAGTYIVSSLTNTSIPQCWIYDDGQKIGQISDKETEITLTEDSIISLRVYQHNGYTYNNMVLKPMIRLAGTDDTFEPHYKGLAELTVNAVLLWENASPTSEFGPQTIALDLTPYRFIEVHVRQSTSSDVRVCTRVEIGTATNGVYGRALIMHDTRETRIIKVLSNGVTFAEGYGGAYNAATSILNGRAIPVKIYGIRG